MVINAPVLMLPLLADRKGMEWYAGIGEGSLQADAVYDCVMDFHLKR